MSLDYNKYYFNLNSSKEFKTVYIEGDPATSESTAIYTVLNSFDEFRLK